MEEGNGIANEGPEEGGNKEVLKAEQALEDINTTVDERSVEIAPPNASDHEPKSQGPIASHDRDDKGAN